MSDYQWDEAWLRQRHGELCAESLSDPQEVWSIDASEFAKKGEASVDALSNAPEDIAMTELVRVSGARWPIERCFQEDKSELGLDHYEHRSWPAWHRHMSLVFLAQLFLVRLRLTYKKSPGVDPTASPAVDRMESAGSEAGSGLHPGTGSLSSTAQLPSLPIPS